MTETYNQSSSGTLNSVDLTINPSMANASIRLRVLHTDATAVLGTDPASTVVFTTTVHAVNQSTTNQPPNTGPSTWSGSISPSNWSGGCQPGLYDIVVYAGGPGASLAGPASSHPTNPGPPVDQYSSGWFSCTG
jgi:hypothetical protein